MYLSKEDEKILDGESGHAKKKSMELLVALGEIYGADKLIPVTSVQIAGVSYHNLGDAGLEFLESLSDGDVVVKTTLNPAGMDIANYKQLGISEEFAKKQIKVIDSFKKMGVIPTCTCTPYLVGNLPSFGEHIAWAESSAVVFANSVIGAKTNREGGPSAIAAAMVGKTPNYGFHLDRNRTPEITVNVESEIKNASDFAALGHAIGEKIKNKVLYLKGIESASLDQLKIFGASVATYSGTALYYMENITPSEVGAANETVNISEEDMSVSFDFLNDSCDVDFVAIGCPHASIDEVKKIASLVKNKKVKIETWITLARPTKELAEQAGYAEIIKDAGIKFACDTCMAVAPLNGKYKCLATNSAKACYYGRGHNDFKTRFGTLEKCIETAVSGKWK